MSGRWIGVDVGGTGVKGAIVSAEGTMYGRCELPTVPEEGRAGLLQRIERVIGALIAEGGPVRGVGIGTAGRVDPRRGEVLYATGNLPGWTGTRLAEALRASTGLPVFAANDADAAAYGEGWIGAARGFDHYAMLTLGTGVGGALIHAGRIVTGRQGAAGELGHAVLYPNGRPCNCGQRGCLEQYVSGTALGRMAKRIDPSWDARRFMEAAAGGDPRTEAPLGEFVEALRLAVRNLQAAFDPDAVVIGGGVGESHSVWWDRLRLALEADASALSVTLAPATLGNDAGIAGAARLAMTAGGAVDR